MKAAIILTLAASTLGAQALPDAPRPSTKLDKTLIALDFGLRTADLISTRNFMSNPCRCIHETDPIAPHTSAIGPQVAFQYGMFLVVTGGSIILRQHHHRKLAQVLEMYDIANESYAVSHNIMLNNDHPVREVK